MRPIKILLTAICTSVSVYSANSFNVSIDGNFNSILLKSNYSIGCVPMYNWRLRDKYDLSIGIPFQFVGKKVEAYDYYEITQYLSLGMQVSLYRTIIKNDWFSLASGGDLFVNYGFPPSRLTTISGSKTKEKMRDAVIGYAGIGLPLVLDCTLNKYMLLRFTQRVLELSADAYFNKDDYDNHINILAGFVKHLSPSMSLLFRF